MALLRYTDIGSEVCPCVQGQEMPERKELVLFLAEMLCSQAALLRRQHGPGCTGLPGRPPHCAKISLLALFNSTCHCRSWKDTTAK